MSNSASNQPQKTHRTTMTYYRILVGCSLLAANACVSSFTVPLPAGTQHRPSTTISTTTTTTTTTTRGLSTTRLHGMVASHPEMEELNKDKDTKNDTNNNEAPAWTPVMGGFLPNLTRRTSTPAASIVPPSRPSQQTQIQQVVSLEDYKRVVVDEADALVVVRFYAPWCRACKAVAPKFKQMAKQYNGHVKFVEVPVRKDNAVLFTGLGVPSLPYGHIYHPEAGLVEERKINKNMFGTFAEVLESYVAGECPVTYDDKEDISMSLEDELPPLQ